MQAQEAGADAAALGGMAHGIAWPTWPTWPAVLLLLLRAHASDRTGRKHSSVGREQTCMLPLSAVRRPSHLAPFAPFARAMREHRMRRVAGSLAQTYTVLSNYTHVSNLLHLRQRVRAHS